VNADTHRLRGGFLFGRNEGETDMGVNEETVYGEPLLVGRQQAKNEGRDVPHT
jgi:hypothetical protein